MATLFDHFEELRGRDEASRNAYIEQVDPTIRDLLQGLFSTVESNATDVVEFIGGMPEVEPARLEVGSCIGPYVIEEVIGQGGMGYVYKGRRSGEQGQNLVAVKTPRSRRFLPYLRQEQKVLGQLSSHESIVSILDAGEEEGRPYFTMEYVEGETLESYSFSSTAELIRVIEQIVSALAHVHKMGIMHLDVKPSNIIIDEGVPKILDFGIAQAKASAGSMPVTRAYAPPELLYERPKPSILVDVFHLGALMSLLLGGRIVSPGEPLGIQLRNGPAFIFANSFDVRQLCYRRIAARAHSFEPSDRYESARELLEDMQAVRKRNKLAVKLPFLLRMFYASYRYIRRNVIVGLLLMAIAALLYQWANMRLEETERQVAEENLEMQGMTDLLEETFSTFNPQAYPLPNMDVEDVLRHLSTFEGTDSLSVDFIKKIEGRLNE